MIQYAWFTGSLMFLLIWGILFIVKKDFRKEMLLLSFLTMLLGVTEPLFVPDYWHPLSLFDLAHRTRFDIESFIFTFAIGGIASVLYKWIFKVHLKIIPQEEAKQKRHRWHGFILWVPLLIFTALAVWTPLNHIYCAIVAMFIGALAALYCRPDLKKEIWLGGFLFLFLYFVFFLIIILIFPDFVKQTWNLSALTGILIFGIPIEELLFAYTFGMLWSGLYEHFCWLKFTNK